MKQLLGKTCISAYKDGDDEIIFETTCGKKYSLHHEQDCCESVYIEDICGSLSDLVGYPILIAEERFQEKEANTDWGDTETWSFFEIGTIKGRVTIRFYGTSNGYYSETAGLYDITPNRGCRG